MSTRLIGTLIMAHADDDGLVLPPRVATQQIVILPITPKEDTREAVIASCQALAETLRHQSYRGEALRVHVDTRDLSGGVKKWEWIKKGVPIRIEIGPRDIETRKICVQRRDQPVSDKEFPDKEDFIRRAAEILDEIHHHLLDRATAFRDANITPLRFVRRLPRPLGAGQPRLALHRLGGHAGAGRRALQATQNHHPLPPGDPPAAGIATGDRCFLTGTETATRALWGRSY